MPLTTIILAAGQGTRMRSALPKVLHNLAGKPLLRHVIEAAQELVAHDIYVVYGHGGELVREALADTGVNWVEQTEQLGTGHAVAQAAPYVPAENVVLVLYGDVPLISPVTLGYLIEEADNDRLALLTVRLEQPKGYGRIVRGKNGVVQCIVEEKDASAEERTIDEVNTGIMAIPARHLRAWLERLDNRNAQSEYYLTDIVSLAVEDGVEIRASHPSRSEEVMGVNDRVQLALLERRYQEHVAEQLMREGVTLVDPKRFDLRGHLTCGRDVIIDVNAVFEGEVILGDEVRISPNTLIRNAQIADGVEILANCVIEDAVIGAHSRIGPFARIRPQTELAEQVHVGNFVEIKKTQVGNGSKINHLSYVGDSHIGRNVNLGAGTITCNYDGANKHQTVIGNDVFVGSDTQLVAPVRVGDRATIGAGSTITRDVPSGKLTLCRSRDQITVNGWKRPIKGSRKG